MNPVTGPYTSTTDSNPLSWFGATYMGNRVSRTSYRQKRPYNLPLPFSQWKHETTTWSQWPHLQAVNSSGGLMRARHIEDLTTNDLNALHQGARSRLSRKIGEAGGLWVTLAERKQAMSMIVNNSRRLLDFGIALRHGAFGQAYRSLVRDRETPKQRSQFAKLTREGKLKNSSRAWADNYLAFHFGWSPLVGEMFNLATLLSSEIPSGRVVAVHSLKYDNSYVSDYPEAAGWTVSRKGVARMHYSALVQVSNPNLRLAQQVGLLDVALVPFELVGFSFVGDWFINFSEFLKQWTEFAGVDIISPSWTLSLNDNMESVWQNAGSPDFSRIARSTSRDKQRVVGSFPSIQLAIRQPWQLSARRGLAAASLLVQQLKR